MIIKNIDQVPLQDVNMEGAKDVKVRISDRRVVRALLGAQGLSDEQAPEAFAHIDPDSHDFSISDLPVLTKTLLIEEKQRLQSNRRHFLS